MDQSVGIVAEQLIVIGFTGDGDRITFLERRISPTVQNGQQQRFLSGHLRNALRPANLASCPSFSSIRSNWLYFAIRSVRLADPVLICPAPVATARSAMNGSSVSPERCDTIDVYPAAAAIAIASRVSVRVPIWFTLMRIELAIPSSMPRFSRAVLVTNKSSPTS